MVGQTPRPQHRVKLVALLLCTYFTSMNAIAAGFAIIEHSAQGMGNAFAGGGAVAEDASTVWFNPASMIRLGPQIQGTAHIIAPSFDFTDGGSVQAAGAGTVALLPGATATSSADKAALVPNLYYVRPINDRMSFGLAINAPFGLATSYNPNWRGRYQAIDSEIRTLHVNPALAIRANEHLTFGFGVNAAYIDASLNNAVDFTAVCLARAGAAAAACTGAGVGPGQGANDGFAQNDADDISFGFNLGLFYEPNDTTRLSVAYRSEIHHKLDGRATFVVPQTLNAVPAVDAALRSAFANDGVSAGVTLPDQLSFSAYHRFHPKFAVMADATWTGWSDIPELRIVFDNPATAGGNSVETLNWENTWRFGLGLNYYHNDRLTLRTGVAYDQAPVTSLTLRTARLPDNDRLWLSFGAGYRATDRLSADFGFSHLFIDDTPIRRTGSTGSVVIGSYKSDVNIFSAQINYRFD